MAFSLVRNRVLPPRSFSRILSSTLFNCARTVGAVAQPASSHSRFSKTNALGGRNFDFDGEFTNDLRGRDFDFDVGKSVLLSPMISVSHIRNMLGRVNDKTPIVKVCHRKCVVKEIVDGIHLRVDMPGLDKKDLKVFVEKKDLNVGTSILMGQEALIIESHAKDKLKDDEYVLEKLRFDLPKNLYKTDAIHAEIYNGVLKVFVPSMKVEANTTFIWKTAFLHVNVDE